MTEYIQNGSELHSEERLVLRQLEAAQKEVERKFAELAKQGIKFSQEHRAIYLSATGAFSGRKWQVEVRLP